MNAVSGGVVDTEALEHFPQKEQMLEWGEKRTPAGRLVTAEDIANAVVFLCSPEAEMIRGHVLVVDGGFLLPREHALLDELSGCPAPKSLHRSGRKSRRSGSTGVRSSTRMALDRDPSDEQADQPPGRRPRSAPRAHSDWVMVDEAERDLILELASQAASANAPGSL